MRFAETQQHFVGGPAAAAGRSALAWVGAACTVGELLRVQLGTSRIVCPCVKVALGECDFCDCVCLCLCLEGAVVHAETVGCVAVMASSLGRPQDTDAPRSAFSGIMIVEIIEATGLVPPSAGCVPR